MARSPGRRRRAGSSPRALDLSDILAGQPVDAATLAALYDLEHDEIVEDVGFYRRWAERAAGDVLDLGGGSGRLLRSFIDGGAPRVVLVDGSPALIDRARERIAADPVLAAADADGRLELTIGDVRTVSRRDRFALVVLAGVVAHLAGPEDGLRALGRSAALLDAAGQIVIDTLGPGALPPHDLPLSVDWERNVGGRQVVRRSSLSRREVPEGLRVEYRTLTDVRDPDGTIARLPAGFSLWYPSVSVIVALAAEAGLEVVAAFGSHDESPLDERSERTIVIMRRSSPADRTE